MSENQATAARRVGIAGLWPWLVTLAYFAVLWPLLREHIAYLMIKAHYHWTPVLVLWVAVSLALQWRRGQQAESSTPQWVSILGYGFLTLLVVVGYLYFTGWLAIVAAIFAVGLLLVQLNDRRQMPQVFGYWALLFLLVRLPFQVEGRLLRTFENMSATLASVILDWQQVNHLQQAHELVLDRSVVDMSTVCNGVFSLYLMIFIAALHGLWRHRPLLHLIGLLVGSTAVAVAVNSVRLVIVAMLANATGMDLMESAWVWALLAGSVILGYLLVLSIDAFLSFMLAAVVGPELKPNGLSDAWNVICGFELKQLTSWIKKPRSKAAARGRLLAVVAWAGLVLSAGFASVILYYEWTQPGEGRTKFMHSDEELKRVDENTLHFDWPGWELVQVKKESRPFESIWGKYSTIWNFKYQDLLVVMALDYPFDKWHDVKVCYTSLGWRVEEEQLLDLKGGNASETQLTLPTGDYGYVLCSHISHLGVPVKTKPTDHQLGMVLYYLHPKQWKAPFGANTNKDQNTFYQTQVMVRTAFPTTDEQRKEIRKAYDNFRSQVRKQLQGMKTP